MNGKSVKVLGYSPYNQWMLHGLWQLTILQSMRMRGNIVKNVFCDGLFDACDMHRSLRPRDEMSCYRCQTIVANQSQLLQMPFEWLGRYLLPSEIHAAKMWSKNISPNRFFCCAYERWPIGSWIESSIHTHFRIPYPDLEDPEISGTCKEYIAGALIACFAFDRLFDEFNPDILLVFNGRFSSTRIALELAKERNIRIYSHERGKLKESLMLRKGPCNSNDELCRAWEEWSMLPLSENESKSMYDFLNGRQQGKADNWIVHSPPLEKEHDLRKKLDLHDIGRPLFVLFNSSDDEIISGSFEDHIFSKQIDWVVQTIEYAKRHPEIDLVIRIHPNIAGKKAVMGDNLQQLSEIMDLKTSLPSNVRIIKPDDPVSSYTLMDMGWVGLVYRSNAGLEMACKGKTVVVADKCILFDKPFVISAHSPIQYGEILESLACKNKNNWDPEICRIAYRFAYLQFFRDSIQFPLVKMDDSFKGAIAYKSLDELLPGRNIELDRIVKILIEDQRIIYPPNEKDASRKNCSEDVFLRDIAPACANSYSSNNINHELSFQLKNILEGIGWGNRYSHYSQKMDAMLCMKPVLQPDISIVVVSWKIHPDTIKSFKILEQQRNMNFELIFVNNGAPDDAFESLHGYIDTYVSLNVNMGPCYARNVGAVFAKAPIVCFLEDDGIPTTNFVFAHISAFRSYDIIGLRGVYRPKSHNPFNQLARHYYRGEKPFPSIINLEGNSSFIAKHFFECGGWDEDIFIMGDGLALSMRLFSVVPDIRKQIYFPEAVIFHNFANGEDHYKEKMDRLKNSMAIIRTKYVNYDFLKKKWDSLAGRYDEVQWASSHQAYEGRG